MTILDCICTLKDVIEELKNNMNNLNSMTTEERIKKSEGTTPLNYSKEKIQNILDLQYTGVGQFYKFRFEFDILPKGYNTLENQYIIISENANKLNLTEQGLKSIEKCKQLHKTILKKLNEKYTDFTKESRDINSIYIKMYGLMESFYYQDPTF